MTQLQITQQAQDVLDQLSAEHGDLIFLISGGCCDGSAPLCFPKEDFKLGESDSLLGHVGQTPVYVSDQLHDFFQGDDSFRLDVEKGRGGGFSLEAPLGVRFLNRAV